MPNTDEFEVITLTFPNTPSAAVDYVFTLLAPRQLGIAGAGGKLAGTLGRVDAISPSTIGGRLTAQRGSISHLLRRLIPRGRRERMDRDFHRPRIGAPNLRAASRSELTFVLLRPVLPCWARPGRLIEVRVFRMDHLGLPRAQPCKTETIGRLRCSRFGASDPQALHGDQENDVPRSPGSTQVSS